MTTVVNVRQRQPRGIPLVYIGRGSVFGNPFTHLPLRNTKASVQVKTRDEAVQAYADWLTGVAWEEVEPERRKQILEELEDLKGKALACYCAPREGLKPEDPLICHGQILARLVDT